MISWGISITPPPPTYRTSLKIQDRLIPPADDLNYQTFCTRNVIEISASSRTISPIRKVSSNCLLVLMQAENETFYITSTNDPIRHPLRTLTSLHLLKTPLHYFLCPTTTF